MANTSFTRLRHPATPTAPRLILNLIGADGRPRFVDSSPKRDVGAPMIVAAVNEMVEVPVPEAPR